MVRHKGMWSLGCLAGLLLMAWPQHSYAEAFIRADVLGLSTNAAATGTLNLGSLSVQDQYYLFPFYLRIEFPSTNFTAWGIQMYTNNNKTQSWTPLNGLSGGLRGLTNPSYGIPMHWQVYDQLQDAVPNWGAANSVTMTAGGLAYNSSTLGYWGRLYDQSDADVKDSWDTSTIVLRRTLARDKGLGDYPVSGRPTANSPIYVYLGLDLTAVTMSQTYGTTLIVDLYNLNIPISQGGYATPNPFTPTTGQKTNFNFSVQNYSAAFKINIYTIRGRKIRTITDSREWDGRNDHGEMMEGGLYIYQIEAEGKRVSGTVVLIK